MSNYDDLLEEARTKAEAYRSTAKEYIPKMYEALRTENPNISPEDARDRIEKDCAGIWAKRTILDALPDEAKNKEKQKAGRLRQKGQNSAAFSAVPQQEQNKKIVVAAIQGKSVDEGLPITSDLSTNDSSFREYDNITNANSIQTGLQIQKDVSDLEECSNCQDLRVEVNELMDALRKATQLKTADQINKPSSSSSDNDNQLENSSTVLPFEFPLPLEDVWKSIINSFNVHKIKDLIWFSGTFDKSTGKVLTACTGRKSQQSTTEDHSDRSVSSSYNRIHH